MACVRKTAPKDSGIVEAELDGLYILLPTVLSWKSENSFLANLKMKIEIIRIAAF